MSRIGNDALGDSNVSVTPRKKRLPGGPKSIPQIQKEQKEAKLRAIREERERESERGNWQPSTDAEIDEEFQNATKNKQVRNQREAQEREQDNLNKTMDAEMDKQFRYRQAIGVPRRKQKKEGKEGRETRVGFI